VGDIFNRWHHVISGEMPDIMPLQSPISGGKILQR